MKKATLNGIINTTWYIRDASGNIMSTYAETASTLVWSEAHIYGSSRLGVYAPEQALGMPPAEAQRYTYYRGTRSYAVSAVIKCRRKLSNHLGNVLVVVSDKLIGTNGSTTGLATYYQADIRSISDYFPFGSKIEDRSWSASGFGYRHGFNGMEQDNEVKGDGNSVDFGARIYDSRLGRWMSTDPYLTKLPYLSPYNFAAANPILFMDIDGKIFVISGATKEDREQAKQDVLSLLPNDALRSAVSFAEDGTVSFNPSDDVLAENPWGNGSGPELLNNLIKAKEKIVYQVGTGESEWQQQNGKGSFTKINTHKLKHKSNGLVNLSTTTHTPKTSADEKEGAGAGQSNVRPLDGIDGLVVVRSDFKWTEGGKPKKRSSLVFHELWENYERTVNKLPYAYPLRKNGKIQWAGVMRPIWRKDKAGAHQKAIDAELRFHDKSDNPGVAD